MAATLAAEAGEKLRFGADVCGDLFFGLLGVLRFFKSGFLWFGELLLVFSNFLGFCGVLLICLRLFLLGFPSETYEIVSKTLVLFLGRGGAFDLVLLRLG